MDSHTEFIPIGSSSLPQPDHGASPEGDAAPARTVTLLLQEWARGDRRAADELFEHVYGELRRLARAQRRRWPDEASLDSTALVHEAYLKLAGGTVGDLRGRAHFFALAARAMRQILSNEARRRHTAKRGNGAAAISLSGLAAPGGNALGAGADEQLLALDDALARLGSLSPRQCQVVECRFFAGLSIPETALALDVSDATVKRDWAVAQAWLYRELHSEAGNR